MKAVKGNKEYSIEESVKKSYLDRGFDIMDDEGEVVAYGRGKTIPFEEYAALVKELEAARSALGAAQEELASLKEKPAGKKSKEDAQKEGV